MIQHQNIWKLDPDYNKTFCFTSGDDYTHVILLNCPTPNISHIPKKNSIKNLINEFSN